MTKFFAGNSLAAFARTTTTISDGVTTAGRFDSAYVSDCILCGTSGANLTMDTPEFDTAATGDLYLRFDCYPGWSNGYTPLTMRNGSTNVLRLFGSGANFLLQYWNGSSWNTLVTFAGANNILNTYVIKLTIGSYAEVIRAGTSLGSSSSAWTGAATQITNFQLSAANGNTYYSQIMCADYDIRESHLIVPALNGDSSANTQGTGGFANVSGALDDATAVKLTTGGHKRGQTKAAITLPSGYLIAAAWVNGRGRANGSITDGKLGIRGSGGTNSSSSGLSYSSGYEPRHYMLETDPDTSVQFTEAGFNAAEPYEEAA